jgi:hypothetical protein
LYFDKPKILELGMEEITLVPRINESKVVLLPFPYFPISILILYLSDI